MCLDFKNNKIVNVGFYDYSSIIERSPINEIQ